MSQKYLLLFSLIFVVLIGIFFKPSQIDSFTSQEPIILQETPEPFLEAIYYGSENVFKVFDHDLPLFNTDPDVNEDGNTHTMHYDGSIELDDSSSYGYDQHIGVDYSLDYVPVLAAAEGTISFAGWSDPSNHQRAYGLHVRMIATANQNYRIWYGHLSTLNVETDEVITASYDDRKRILGISGNTGRGIGCDLPIYDDPDCSAHLHFEVRLSNRPVNPYGWIGNIIDPWSEYGDNEGATSHNLWINPPAIDTAQYPGGTAIAAPPQTGYFIEVDDSDPAFFTTHGNCWTNNDDFHYATAVPVDVTAPPPANCYAEWSFDPTLIAPAGEYDVYARIPAEGTSLHTLYTIRHNQQTSEAIAVQGAYPNDNHDEWAYLGRYEFALNGVALESISISNQTIDDPASTITNTFVVADAIRLHPANPVPDLEINLADNNGHDDAGGPNQTSINACSGAHYNAPEVYFGRCKTNNTVSDTVSGFRFENVAVPANATITAARLEFVVDGTYTVPLDLQIQGELGGNPTAFYTDSLPHTRDPLTLFVPWSLDASDKWVSGGGDTTPDLSPIIQALIEQETWQMGQAMVFIIKPTASNGGDAARRVFAWEREGNKSLQTAKLQLWFNAPPPAPTGLTAVYYDDIPQPHLNKVDDYEIIGPVVPNTYVRLSWPTATYPTGTTFKVYRSGTGPPVPPQGLIGTAISVGGLSGVSFWDYNGQNGDWYVITAVNAHGESAPSTPVRAWPPCPPSIC